MSIAPAIAATPPPANEDRRPILVVPYMWIGDFVRCHSVVRVLNARFPARPVDLLATALTAPLADYMPGVRQAIISDLPRRRLAVAKQSALAARLKAEDYGMALIMPRTWKAALAPYLAGVPERVGFFGEGRFILVNDLRWGERALERMIDRCAALALPKDAALPGEWPLPQLSVPASEVAAWRSRNGLTEQGPVVALCPGAVGPSKRWPAEHYGALAQSLTAAGASVWVLGGPAESPLAEQVAAAGGRRVRNLTGTDLRDAILALTAADVAVSNDSGLLHVAAALDTPSIGIFGPTSPRLWAPLNPLAAVIETAMPLDCRPCHKPTCRMGHHLCMRSIAAEQVLREVRSALATTGFAAALE